MLLIMVPGHSKWCSILDLNNAFFCIPVDEQAQLLFAFKWQDPETKAMLQYCWTVLPQGFKNSSTIFGEILAKDLRNIPLKSGVLLQYIDAILKARSTCEDCFLNTITVLNHLANRGYKVSPHNAQICKQEVVCLRFQPKQGTRSLIEDRKQEISTLKIPENQRWLLRFLGLTGFC